MTQWQPWAGHWPGMRQGWKLHPLCLWQKNWESSRISGTFEKVAKMTDHTPIPHTADLMCLHMFQIYGQFFKTKQYIDYWSMKDRTVAPCLEQTEYQGKCYQFHYKKCNNTTLFSHQSTAILRTSKLFSLASKQLTIHHGQALVTTAM